MPTTSFNDPKPDPPRSVSQVNAPEDLERKTQVLRLGVSQPIGEAQMKIGLHSHGIERKLLTPGGERSGGHRPTWARCDWRDQAGASTSDPDPQAQGPSGCCAAGSASPTYVVSAFDPFSYATTT